MLVVANGKYKGGDTILAPFACMNDGLLNVTWFNEDRLNTLMGVVQIMGEAKKGKGIQIYSGNFASTRAK